MLLDLEHVARCLPGAATGSGDEEGALPGSMRVKLGPVTMDYKGAAWLDEMDEGARTAVLTVQGKEAQAQGSVSATTRNRLVEQKDTQSILADFAECLSQTLVSAPAESKQPEAPKLGGTVGRVLLDRITGFFARLLGQRRPSS